MTKDYDEGVDTNQDQISLFKNVAPKHLVKTIRQTFLQKFIRAEKYCSCCKARQIISSSVVFIMLGAFCLAHLVVTFTSLQILPSTSVKPHSTWML